MFKKNAFICEYVGKVLTSEAVKDIEKNYEQQPDVGCYVLFQAQIKDTTVGTKIRLYNYILW